MFESRLRFLLYVVGGVAILFVLRLAQLQIVQADHYSRRAERALVLRPVSLPFVRGSILDRTGLVLVQDEPAWDVSIDYAVLVAAVGDRTTDTARLLRGWKRSSGWHREAVTDTELETAFRRDLERMWRDIAGFASSFDPVSIEDLKDRARKTYDRISRIRQAVARRRGFDAPVAEEKQPHSLLSGLDARQQVAARDRIAMRYPWVHVQPSTVRRVVGDAPPFAHVLGRLGRVDASHVADDPRADDPFAKYLAHEKLGVAGVERVAEKTLRGRRGQRTKDRSGQVIEPECFDAQDGEDVRLGIHAELQRQLFHLLGETVESVPESCGGAIVVLDVATREVLALVSYPSYDPNQFNDVYRFLREDTDRLPLRFRAVANQYAPGSTLKPLTCLSGLMGGQIRLDTREECTGYLLPHARDRWRCWTVHGTNVRKAHGMINVVEALTGSCNVFMFRLGERIGVDGLCSAFDMFGIGRYSGTGLIEETRGINPTPSWLMSHKNISATPGTARLFAIGQAEVSLTPVQVANLMATYASGVFRPVSLIRDRESGFEWILPVKPAHWRAIRQGIYGVVNDPDGTAYKYAHFDHEHFALCGKTGSATAHRWPTAYRIPYTDENGALGFAVIRAGAKREAVKKFKRQFPTATLERDDVEVASHWPPQPPPPGDRYSHAWFGGYLQKLDAFGQPDWTSTPSVAFAVLVEFGGSGGRTNGPLVKRLAQILVDFGFADADNPRG